MDRGKGKTVGVELAVIRRGSVGPARTKLAGSLLKLQLLVIGKLLRFAYEFRCLYYSSSTCLIHENFSINNRFYQTLFRIAII